MELERNKNSQLAAQVAKDNFLEAENCIKQFLAEKDNLDKVVSAAQIMAAAFKQGNKVMSCGNGGSMCDAMHFAEELSGKFREERPPLPAFAISDPGYLSCVSNDYGYQAVFERYIKAFGKKGDVLLAISTSGNSENVIRAVKAALAKEMTVVSLTGKDGGLMKTMDTLEIRAPYSRYADRAQEIHIKVIHSLIHLIEHQLLAEDEH